MYLSDAVTQLFSCKIKNMKSDLTSRASYSHSRGKYVDPFFSRHLSSLI